MKAHVRLIGNDVALPVDDHLSSVALIGNGVDASGECLWAASIRDEPIDRPLGNEPYPQGGDLRQLRGAPGIEGRSKLLRARLGERREALGLDDASTALSWLGRDKSVQGDMARPFRFLRSKVRARFDDLGEARLTFGRRS